MILNILIIIAVSLIFYWRTLNYGYVSDDVLIKNASKPTGKFWVDLWLEIKGQCYFNPKHEHAISMVIHTINSVLVYLAFGADKISFWAAILWCINPANNQCAIWLSGKPYAISVMICLLGVWCKAFAPLYFYIFHWGINGIMFPLVFVNMHPHWLVLMFPLYFVVRRKIIRDIKIGKVDLATKRMTSITPEKFVLAVKTFSYYFTVALFPVKLGMYHKFGYVYGLTKEDSASVAKLDAHFWSGLILMLLFGYMMFTNWDNGIGMGLWWWCVFLSMWCNLIVIQQFIAERYLYAANVGLMYALSYVIWRII